MQSNNNGQSEERKNPTEKLISNESVSQWELIIKPSKLPKARENVGDQVAIGFCFASDCVSFLDQSRSKVKQKQSHHGLLLTLNWKLLWLSTC